MLYNGIPSPDNLLPFSAKKANASSEGKTAGLFCFAYAKQGRDVANNKIIDNNIEKIDFARCKMKLK